MKFDQSKALQDRCHSVIPGGAHTYAKGEDQYPVNAPAFLVKGKGCRVWDVDGNEFIEYGMGLRAVTLGHAYEPVVEAAYRQMQLGENFTRPATIELECAEMLLETIGIDGMVKFGKNGSDATTAAIKLARAFTGRDRVAICGDQPFFSVHDWFIGSTEMNAGIPTAIRDLTLKFRFNDIDSIRALFEQHPDRIACLIMEPAGAVEPVAGFLQDVKRLCHENGALFVLDETITGFRWHIGGGQKYYGVEADLSVFGKALGNGFSVSALVGRPDIMELCGLRHGRERVFALSQTHGAENHCLAASTEVMRTYRNEGVVERLHEQGAKLAEGIRQCANQLELADYFQVLGKPCNLVYATLDQNRKRSQEFRALFLQETIRRGVLAPSLVVSFAHPDDIIQRTVEAIAAALTVYRKALDDGVEKHLVGRPVKPVFRKFS